jgi:hypothetical protein
MSHVLVFVYYIIHPRNESYLPVIFCHVYTSACVLLAGTYRTATLYSPSCSEIRSEGIA